MPPSPKLYSATVEGVLTTQSVGLWAEHLGFTTMTVRRHLKLAGGDMQKAILTIGAKRPSLGRRR